METLKSFRKINHEDSLELHCTRSMICLKINKKIMIMMTLLKMNHMRMKEHTIGAPATVIVLGEECYGH
jgi:hypothetical protein